MWYPEQLVRVSGKIERIARLSQEAFKHYVASKTPVIIERGLDGDVAADSEMACPTWTRDSLKNSIGDNECEVYVSKDGLYDEAHHKIVKMTLGECIDRMYVPLQAKPLFWPNERYYLYKAPPRLFGAALRDLAVPEFLSGVRSIDERNLWMSQPGNVTPPHMDFAANLLVQLHGRKSILLWDSSQWSNLYLNPFGHAHARQSQIDITKPDMTRFPLFAQARAVAGVLEPGNALFNPFASIHCLYSDTFSILLEYVWERRPLNRLKGAVMSPLLGYFAQTPRVALGLLWQGALRRVSHGTRVAHDTNVPAVIDTAVRFGGLAHG